MNILKTLSLLALFCLSALAQSPFAFAAIRESANREAARFAETINTNNATIYENALKDAALNFRQKAVALPVLSAPAKIRMDVDQNTLVFTVVALNEPVSSKTIQDFTEHSGGPGFPVGPPNNLGGFIAMDACYIGQLVTVAAERYICGTYNNSVFARMYYKLQ